MSQNGIFLQATKARQKLAKIILNLIYLRPRYDLTKPYFVTAYKNDIRILHLHAGLAKKISEHLIADRRQFVQEVEEVFG